MWRIYEYILWYHSHFCIYPIWPHPGISAHKTCIHGYSERLWLFSSHFHSSKLFGKRFQSQFFVGVVKQLGEVLFLEVVSLWGHLWVRSQWGGVVSFFCSPNKGKVLFLTDCRQLKSSNVISSRRDSVFWKSKRTTKHLCDSRSSTQVAIKKIRP
jgi:hypothetical protein